MKKIKLLHVITSLNQGGAEAMLYKLLANSSRDKFDLYVLSLLDEGVFGEKIKDLQIPVYCLNMTKRSFSLITSVIRCYKLIKELKPDVVQGWMPHANLLIFLMKLFLKDLKITFNIRQSILNNRDNWLTKIVSKLNAFFSKFAVAVINNSYESQKQHQEIGFSKKNAIYIPNGFDTNMFKPDVEIYKSIRKSLNLSEDTKIIGNIGRYHPVKNHLGLLAIFQKIKLEYKSPIIFILGGAGVDANNKQLIEKIKTLDLQDCCFLLGKVDSQAILPAFDVYISSSLSEGFPNVIGEAMACGVPCVATDVGDCKLIINEFGSVVPSEEYAMLAKNCIRSLEVDDERKSQMREYIIERYSIENIVEQYEKLYINIFNKII